MTQTDDARPMRDEQSEEERRRIVDSNSVTCSTCQARLKQGWENIRAHTLKEHGREPLFSREGRYPSRAVSIAAYAGAFPDLIMCA